MDREVMWLQPWLRKTIPASASSVDKQVKDCISGELSVWKSWRRMVMMDESFICVSGQEIPYDMKI